MTKSLIAFFARTLPPFPFRGLLAAALALCGVATAAPWADVPSDLPQDPALTLGALPNGLRYALLPNAEPAGRVSLRLLVSVGSLHENDDERGLAHFVEHMAFRGSHSRPHGELIASLERMGVSFGPDSAAFVGHDHTIYHLDLPDATAATVREALRVFRDYSASIEFAPDDIKRERGVILSEMRARDTGEARAGQRSLAFIWPGARQLSRQPIGIERQINRFNQKQFRAFHDAWYRPERIAIIAVGQIDPGALRAMITDEFGGLTARAPARPEPPGLVPLPPAKSLRPLEVFTDKDVAGFNVSLSHAQPEIITAWTREHRRRHLHESLACYMLQRRVLLESRKPGAITGNPIVTTMQLLPGMRATHFSVSGNLMHWEGVLAHAEQALRRAREHGFNQNELDTARDIYANNWRQAVRAAPTRRSENLCAELANFLLRGGGFHTPETSWRAHEELLASATPADCRAALDWLWGDSLPRVFIAACEDFSRVERPRVEKTIIRSRVTAVYPPPKAAARELAWKNTGPDGEIASEKHLAEHGIRLVAFENNTLLNFKRTDFEKDYVLINARAGFGRLVQPGNKPGIDLLATHGFYAGGVEGNSFEDITQIAEQHMLGMSFHVDDDALNFTIHCPASETRAALRLLAACITQPGFSRKGKEFASPAVATIFSQQLTSPSACIASRIERAITGDTRFGWPDFAEFASRNMFELGAWMKPQLAFGAIEIGIVGDIAAENAIDAVRSTLGALPRRATRAEAAAARNHFIPPIASAITFQKTASPVIVPVNPTLKQGAFACVWPVPAKLTTHQERACHLLAHALANAARTRLREELGAAYNVSANFVRHDGFDTFNYYVLHAEVDNSRLNKAIAATRDCVARLAGAGISEDEFLRAKKPFAENYDRWMLTNAYWCFTVLRDAQTNPVRIEAMQNRLADVASITREEINALAAQHLRRDTHYLFKTAPAKK